MGIDVIIAHGEGVDDFSNDATGGPEVDGVGVGFVAEEQLGWAVACCAHVCDFLVCGLGGRVGGGPGDAEVGEVDGTGWGGEEDVGGFDVAVDEVVGVQVGEGGEEGVDGFFCEGGGEGGGSMEEEGGEVVGLEGEGEEVGGGVGVG